MRGVTATICTKLVLIGQGQSVYNCGQVAAKHSVQWRLPNDGGREDLVLITGFNHRLGGCEKIS